MNAINAATNAAAHFDRHAAGEPTNFEQACRRSGFHCLVRVGHADQEHHPWTTTVFGVSRQGDDPSTDVVNFEQPLYDCRLEQSPGCDHPTNHKAVHTGTGTGTGSKSGPDQKSNVELLEQAIQQVTYAVIDVGSYDDESETMTYHSQQLEFTEHAMTKVRNTCATTPTPTPQTAVQHHLRRRQDAAVGRSTQTSPPPDTNHHRSRPPGPETTQHDQLHGHQPATSQRWAELQPPPVRQPHQIGQT